MQKYTIFIGIDISKQWFDACLYWSSSQEVYPHAKFDNTLKGYKTFLKWIKHQVSQQALNGAWYICMEHTGVYSWALADFLNQQKLTVIQESPLRIKRSLGLKRGKDDRRDALSIAQYAARHYQDIKVRPLLQGVLLKVQSLLSLRARLVRYRHGLRVAHGELLKHLPESISQPIEQYTLPVTQSIDAQIKQLDQLIKKLIQEEDQLYELYKLVRSVKGIGPINAAYLLVYTNGFSAFDKARQFACYIGVAPFSHQSGSSIKRPDQVSELANRRLKALISTAATVAVRFDPQLKAYFLKQQQRQKSDGWIYNAVKNKIIHRVFAVVKRGTPYVVLNH